MAQNIVMVLACLAEAFIIYLYFEDNYENKFRPLVSLLIGGALIICSSVGNMFSTNFNLVIINSTVFYIVTILYAKISFDISVKAALFHSAIIDAVMIATEMITEMLATLLFDSFVMIHTNSLLTYILFAAFSKLMMLIALKLVSSLFSYKKSNANGQMKHTLPLLLFPLMISAFLMLDFRIAYQYKLSARLAISLGVISILSVFACCFIFIYNIRIQRNENELRTLQAQQQKNEMDMQYLNLLEQKNQAMQILTHDYKNHLFALRNMGGAEQQEYIDRITDEMSASRNTCHSGNHMLDIIINKYVTECELKGVTFDFEIKISNLSFVSDYDLVTILGNLLDNALEAAQHSEAKTITFKTNKINTYDSVMITNSCDTPPDKNLITTKQNKKLHGVGLKSITKTLKQYGGELEWEYNSEKREFVTTVILLEKAI